MTSSGEHTGVLVFAECSSGGNVTRLTREIMGLGGELADLLGEDLSAALIGSGLQEPGRELVALGAGRVYVADDPELSTYNPGLYVPVMRDLIGDARPGIVVFGHTPAGQDLAPRLAFEMGTALTTDCVKLDIDAQSRRLLATKPVYGGVGLGSYRSDKSPQMATVRPRVGREREPDPAAAGEQVMLSVDADATGAALRHVRTVGEEAEGVRLEDAPVVVSGGRGIGGPEGFEKLEAVAGLLGGAVGASRPPCDLGWMPSTGQVGITGKNVAPDLYVAVALSGSSQHLSGMTDSGKIVAVNNDPDATIFTVADYGVVGEWSEVVGGFTEALRGLLSERE
ncbi:MAG: electron transfer flavoprotein subunit alpha/FixB family protein [Actinobacteria bacterium]|nr:electron transfer flavoprotein subunit alpha/FixB family protein [Actinomycetota bacterium]MBU4219952.1 electron transfer flavoprotein subunit alpha/FixB family protein [Actinomycetota bacterium]MBU4358298.1 electron transfer flavoprotein subunit alpha/FixB family protein [Actinomycetota bacterium]MCG2818422.1 electron transfer flavoprotein subunit alpha/FixB family protein [Actinomycetes bacterium]